MTKANPDMDSDFCDRLPGQHTGRLSLELQASEAAEWQETVDMLASRFRNLENEVARLKAAPPAARESPGISPEPAQAHGLSEHQLRAIGEAVSALRFCASQNDWYTEERSTELRNIANALTGIEIDAAATPSAAVGASEPVAGDHKEWCDGAKEFCERQVESDTVPRAEYDRVLTLNHHLREVAVMAITERVPSDSKPTNCINPESEDTPPRGNDAPATGKPFQLEHGKQYLRRDGKVSGVMTQTKGGEYSVSHPLWDDFHCLSYRPDGRYNVSEAEDKFDLISEYHEPEPIPPAESPDDWVTQDRATLRKCDEYRWKWKDGTFSPWGGNCESGYKHGDSDCADTIEIRCRRKDLPVKPVVTPALPSPWRPMTDDYPRDKVLWVARDDGLVYTERNPDEWPLAKAVAWMLAVTPVHPNAAPPVVPKTRTITLREYLCGDKYWTTFGMGLQYTGRTCECEVPE